MPRCPIWTTNDIKTWRGRNSVEEGGNSASVITAGVAVSCYASLIQPLITWYTFCCSIQSSAAIMYKQITPPQHCSDMLQLNTASEASKEIRDRESLSSNCSPLARTLFYLSKLLGTLCFHFQRLEVFKDIPILWRKHKAFLWIFLISEKTNSNAGILR